MPPLEMRGRYIQREFFADTDLHTRATADTREFYIGLWMLADDSGWMPRDLLGIGASIYRFKTIEERERLVRAGLESLSALGKVRSHRCKCLFLPAVARYPRAGKPNTVHESFHQSHLKGFNPNGSKPQKDLEGSSSIQKDLNPSPVPTRPDPSQPSAGARDGLQARVGSFEQIVGGKR